MHSIKQFFIYQIIVIIACTASINAQNVKGSASNYDYSKLMIEGNKLYKDKRYEEASKLYNEAKRTETDPYASTYNEGNSQYKQEKYDDAIQHYDESFSAAKNADQKAYSLYNKGNAQYKLKDYENAIKSYKDALKYTPKDQQIIQDLAKAKMQNLIKQQQEKQNEDSKNDKDKQENKDQKQDKGNQDQKGDNQNKDDQNQNKESEGDQDQQNQKGEEGKDTKGKMTQQEIDRMLQMIENQEKEVQQKLKRINAKSKKQVKDW